MMEHVSMDLLSPMIAHRPNTPVGRSGSVRIEIDVKLKGEKIVIVSMRNAFLMGQKPTNMVSEEPFEIRQLIDDEYGTWMTDSPQEIWQMKEAIVRANGRVLVGGLGLGVLSHLIAELSKDVSYVLTVERNQDIINLVDPYLNCDCESIKEDLFQYLKHLTKNQHDFAVFDIWQLTSEKTWANYVVPLRRLCRSKINKIVCWNEDEMIGQLDSSIARASKLDESFSYKNSYGDYIEVFRQALMKQGIFEPTVTRMDNNEEAFQKLEFGEVSPKVKRLLKSYLSPGTDSWEKKFGDLWDEFVKPITDD